MSWDQEHKLERSSLGFVSIAQKEMHIKRRSDLSLHRLRERERKCLLNA